MLPLTDDFHLSALWLLLLQKLGGGDPKRAHERTRPIKSEVLSVYNFLYASLASIRWFFKREGASSRAWPRANT